MSKIFWDRLVILEEVEKAINSLEISTEEKEELWQIIDEIIHHQLLGCIFDRLHTDHHQDFLDRFHQNPADESLLEYLDEKIENNFSSLVQDEIKKITLELLEEIS